METTQEQSIGVETPTTYNTHTLLKSEAIKLRISGVSQREVTAIAQQLSLFIETHDLQAFNRLLKNMELAIDSSEQFNIELGKSDTSPTDCYWPIKLETEDIGFEKASEIVVLRQAAKHKFN